jgi:glycosyltransferase involved in cell wall biosynthesis
VSNPLKVSIITISYNQAEFLERAIRSVLDQDYSNLEYIVVDPGSKDGSRELIRKYEPRLKPIIEPDHGPGDGLNKGFAAATGDIFGYINADDAFLPGAIGEVAAEFERDPEIDVISGHGYKVDAKGNVLRPIYSDLFTLRRRILGAASLVQQSTFFRREAFLATGGFNNQNRTCWDGELMVDMGLRGKRFKVVNRYWSLFTMHPGGISGSGRLEEQYRKDEARLFRKITGRDPQAIDVAGQTLCRIGKSVAHPVRLARNVIGRIHQPAKKLTL